MRGGGGGGEEVTSTPYRMVGFHPTHSVGLRETPGIKQSSTSQQVQLTGNRLVLAIVYVYVYVN